MSKGFSNLLFTNVDLCETIDEFTAITAAIDAAERNDKKWIARQFDPTRCGDSPHRSEIQQLKKKREACLNKIRAYSSLLAAQADLLLHVDENDLR